VKPAQARQRPFRSPEVRSASRLRPSRRISEEGAFDAGVMLREDTPLARELPRQDEQRMMRGRFDDLL
jgi:hypothetical protein